MTPPAARYPNDASLAAFFRDVEQRVRAVPDVREVALAEKGLDLIVLNETGPDTGFEVDTNRVTLIEREGESEEVPLLEKDQVADRILDRVERRLPRLDGSDD